MRRPLTLTVGWIARHTPPGAGVDGRDAAVIDIAQERERHLAIRLLTELPGQRLATLGLY